MNFVEYVPPRKTGFLKTDRRKVRLLPIGVDDEWMDGRGEMR
jgi:hypothetical protein